MKKFLLLLTVIVLASCSNDECEQSALCTKMTAGSGLERSSAKSQMNTSLTEDTTLEGDQIFNGGLNLNGFTLVVTGEVQVNGHLNGPGTLEYCEVLEVTGHTQNNPELIDNCSTLSDGGLVFRDGEVVEIPCKYNLPFIYVDDNGAQWLYEAN